MSKQIDITMPAISFACLTGSLGYLLGTPGIFLGVGIFTLVVSLAESIKRIMTK